MKGFIVYQKLRKIQSYTPRKIPQQQKREESQRTSTQISGNLCITEQLDSKKRKSK